MRFGIQLLILAGLMLSQGCETLNSQLAASAAIDAVKAATLSDEQVIELSNSAAAVQDKKHQLAPAGSSYAKRLEMLTRNFREVGGVPLDTRAYISDQVNAFAMANGTIRVYSGLMDAMTDHELLFVIGHEIGHVFHGHSKKKAQVAYSTSALRKGIGSLGGTVGTLALSDIGAISENIVNAQYSQKEEIEADDYGLSFMLKYGYPPQAGVTALRKLGSGGGGLFSSHPDSQERAERLENKIAR